VLVVDKPRGWTSHDAVLRVRRALRVREVGHTGTLDPMATGVLVLAIGEATKLVPWLTAKPKVYEASLTLGIETDTLDADGREVRRVEIDPTLLAALAEPAGAAVTPALAVALDGERARTLQVPPAYSAIRAGGERAFVRARRGEDVALPARPVTVHRLEVTTWSREPPTLSLSLEVSKGYYVRALARDLAEAVGTVAHLCRLRRTRSGAFTTEEAVSPEAPADVLRSAMIPMVLGATRSLPPARLSEEGVRDARHGRPVAPADIEASSREPSAWLDSNGDLVAVGAIDETGRGTVIRGFREATASSSAPSDPSRSSPELP
jgi:tRNA pseudouridine55 synthase